MRSRKQYHENHEVYCLQLNNGIFTCKSDELNERTINIGSPGGGGGHQNKIHNLSEHALHIA